MAARTPTSWTEYLDEKDYLPTRKVLENKVDSIFNDQFYSARATKLIYSSCTSYSHTLTTAVNTWGPGLWNDTRNSHQHDQLCKTRTKISPDGATTVLTDWWIRAYALAGTPANLEVRIRANSGGGGGSSTVAMASGSPAWYNLSSTFLAATADNQEESFILEARQTAAGTYTLALLGIIGYAVIV